MSRSRIDALALDLNRALARDLDRAVTLASDLNQDRAAAVARDLTRDLSRALDLIGGLDHRDIDYARALDLARARALDLARDLDRTRDLDCDLDLAEALGSARNQCVKVVGLIEVATTARESATGPGAPVRKVTARPARIAVGVIERMLRVLPALDQCRYRQEYLAELYALADERAPRRVQLAHAVRAATTMWSLRQALRAPRPGRERTL